MNQWCLVTAHQVNQWLEFAVRRGRIRVRVQKYLSAKAVLSLSTTWVSASVRVTG